MRVDVGDARQAEGAFVGFAILAPEIDFPRQRRFQLMQRRPAASRRQRRCAVPGRMFSRQLGIGLDLRKELRARDAGRRQCLPRARFGDAQRRAARQRFIDQPVELRIVQRFPPIACGHGAAADVPANERSADNCAALRCSACVDSPAVLAQAPASNDAHSSIEKRTTLVFMR
jgi:hypothetical protein